MDNTENAGDDQKGTKRKSAQGRKSQTDSRRSYNEVSPDTQAIINRLTHEGELLRNSGANSIRSVKVELEKFTGVFQSISTSMIEQNSLMKQSLDLTKIQSQDSKEAIQAAKDAEDLTPPAAAVVPKKRSFMDTAKEKGKDALGFMGSIAKIAGGLFVGYNILKGIIDEVTGGKFTEYETKFTNFLKSLTEGMGSLSEVLTHPLTWLVGGAVALKYLRGSFSALGLGLKAAGAVFSGGKKLLQMMGLVGPNIPGGGKVDKNGNPVVGTGDDDKDKKKKDDKDKKKNSKFKKPTLKGIGIGAIVATATSIALDAGGDMLRENGVDTTLDIGDREIDVVDSASTVLEYAAWGMMFGPKGALVGAIVGGAVVIGNAAVDYINDSNDKSKTALVQQLGKEFQTAEAAVMSAKSVEERAAALAKLEEEKKILQAKIEADIAENEKMAKRPSNRRNASGNAKARSKLEILRAQQEELDIRMSSLRDMPDPDGTAIMVNGTTPGQVKRQESLDRAGSVPLQPTNTVISNPTQNFYDQSNKSNVGGDNISFNQGGGAGMAPAYGNLHAIN